MINVAHLMSLEVIRERAQIVYDAAKEGRLNNFDFHEDKLGGAADYVTGIIKRDFGPSSYDKIPPHGRWQHFEVGDNPRVSRLLSSWTESGIDTTESTRRLVDLFFVSVLLDAGAGDTWTFTEASTGESYGRSEGLAVASLYMFTDFAFSSTGEPKVDSEGLQSLTVEKLGQGLQISESNKVVGLEPRANLLSTLGRSLKALPDIFGLDGRPGNLVVPDYLLKSSANSSSLDVKVLWNVLQQLLLPIWPTDRTSINGIALGDAWPLKLFQKVGGRLGEAATIQPFHKLTQWLTYSLMVPFTSQLKISWTNTNLLTGLPEYRNGGLFVDKGVLTLKPKELERGIAIAGAGNGLPKFSPNDDVIVEWRAMTVILLDALYEMILTRLRADDPSISLSMAQVLESGTWKAGREIAAELRPLSKSSPLLIDSDGTVF